MRAILVSLLLILPATWGARPAYGLQHGAGGVAPTASQQLADDARSWRDVARSLEDSFGPLPAIATAPFLGLAVLGTSALLLDALPPRYAESPALQRVRSNALIQRARKYASVPAVLALFVLALLTYLANSGKLQGAFGKAAGAVEAVVAGGAYLALALPALHAQTGPSFAPAPTGPVIAAQLGPTLLGSSFLVAGLSLAASFVALIVVRLAIGVLVWLIPVPAIDLVFETGKKVFSLGFLVLYLVSPWLALLSSAVIVSIAWLLFRWALRLLGFCWRIIVRPLLGRFVPPLRSGDWPRRAAMRAGLGPSELAFAYPAAALRVNGLKYRQSGVLAGSHVGLWFVLPGLFRARRIQLDAERADLALHAGLTWTELSYARVPGGEAQRLALPLHSGVAFDGLLRELGARDGGAHGTMSAVRLVGRGVRAAMAATGRSSQAARTGG